MTGALRVTTWNLQGRERPDLDVVAVELLVRSPDVVLLQEIQERQAAFLARRLGWSVAWYVKHRPLVVPAEGAAVLTPVRLLGSERLVLASGPFWSSRRRIAVSAMVEIDGEPLRVISVHLGAGVGDEERLRQAWIVIDGADDAIVGGDMNAGPGSPVIQAFAERGFRDAWDVAQPGRPGPTNWRKGRRDGPPSARIDYVLAGPGWETVDAELPAHGDPGFERFGPLSDHLPLTVTLQRSPRRSAPAADHPSGPGAGG